MDVIAYFLPQFYPIRENNEWWGNGFTEWTNVGKAKKLFPGHEQPKIPKDLGYYDLRLQETVKNQIILAKFANIKAFCIWNYWFGNGYKVLELYIEEYLKNPKLDLNYCIGWANESWKSKTWNNIDKYDKILIEQKYPGNKDIEDYFYYCLKFFKDKRYYKIKGKPVFLVYKPLLIPKNINFVNLWNDLAKLNGFKKGFYFIGHTLDFNEKESILKLGYDAVNIVRIGEHKYNPTVTKRVIINLIFNKIFKFPLILNYKFISNYFISNEEKEENIIPTIIPNWDHTPRSKNKGLVFHKSTPELFKKHIIKVKNIVENKKNKLVFLKSWNEWGEGNYIEPDLKYGSKYLEVLKDVTSLKK